MKQLISRMRSALGGLNRLEDFISTGRAHAKTSERSLMLQGRMAAELIGAKARLHELADAEFSVFSQWGEDGIIEWLVRHVAVPSTSFIEFGVENFSEANCSFLMRNRNWRGMVIDGSREHMERLRREDIHWKYDLLAIDSFITAENIDGIIASNGFGPDLGILSVDIDGVDYWVLNAIEAVRPAILIAEYNAVFGDRLAVTVPYDPRFQRHAAHHSGLYFGASLIAMRRLAEARGYVFVGTPRTGVNAFFVRADLADGVTSALDAISAYPTRYRESRDTGGALTYKRGIDRFLALKGMTVIDVDQNREVVLDDPDRFYSEDWRRLIA